MLELFCSWTVTVTALELNKLFVCLFVYLFRDSVLGLAQPGLELGVFPRLTFKTQSSCLSFLCDEFIGMHSRAWLKIIPLRWVDPTRPKLVLEKAVF